MYIGLDIGTTNVKGLLVDGDGKILMRETRTLKIHSPKPGWNEQDPRWWVEAVLEILRSLSAKAEGNIEAVSVSGQMHSLVMLDEDGDVLRNAILWNDQRTFEECEYINRSIGEQNLINIVGNPMYPGFTFPKLLWIRRNEPDVFKKIRVILLPKDYINYILTGKMTTEYSDASGTGVLDIRYRSWANDLIEEFGIPLEIFPEIKCSNSIVGEIKEDISNEIGVKKGTIVIAGGADNACAALGIDVVNEGDYMISLGTSGTVLTPTQKLNPDSKGRLHFFCHVIPETFYHMGVMLSATFSFEWLRERFLEEKDYDLINSRVSEVPPGSNGIIFLPYLNGERTPHRDPFARGCFIGLSAKNSKWDVVRSVFEGVAFGIRDSFEIMRELGINFERGRITGGGAKSPVWKQIVADVIGLNLETAEIEEGASYGASLLAFSGHRGVNPKDVAKEWVKSKEVVNFSHDVHQFYSRRYEIYKRIYLNLRDIFKVL